MSAPVLTPDTTVNAGRPSACVQPFSNPAPNAPFRPGEIAEIIRLLLREACRLARHARRTHAERCGRWCRADRQQVGGVACTFSRRDTLVQRSGAFQMAPSRSKTGTADPVPRHSPLLNPGFHLIANGFPMARIADAVTLPTPRSAERTGAGGVKLATGGNG
jgi:hypothetical protein